jgi:hypothetical protein
MTSNRFFTLRSYEWWTPARKRRVEERASFEPDLIFPVAWAKRVAWPPSKRSQRSRDR